MALWPCAIHRPSSAVKIRETRANRIPFTVALRVGARDRATPTGMTKRSSAGRSRPIAPNTAQGRCV